MRWRVVAIVFFLPVVVLAAFYLWPQKVFLIATKELSIEKTMLPNGKPEVVRILKAGERIGVIACEDNGSFLAVRVGDKGGAIGYVVDTNYQLEKAPFWDSRDGPISSTCVDR